TSAACATVATIREAIAWTPLQIDVKFLERIPGTRKRLYQFTAIDDCTRIRVLKVYDACNQGTAVPFLDEVLRRLPFRVQGVQTENGAEFKSHLLSPGSPRHPPCVYQAANTASEWQSRAVPPNRRPRVLPAARQGRHHR